MSSLRYCYILCWISGNRAWTRTSIWEMRLGARWIELARRNQVKILFWTELRTAIIKISDHNTRNVDSVKKWPELWIAILKITDCNYWGWKRDSHFESGFLEGSKENDTPSSQTSLNTLKNWSQAKRGGEHHWRRRTQEPGKKSKIFLVYSFFYSFLMLCCYLNMNICVIFDMICG
jgi:hypothetical protein